MLFMLESACTAKTAYKGGRLASEQGVMLVDVFQALSLMIAFATLVVLVMSDKRK